MANVINPTAVHERGLAKLEQLDPDELAVYSVLTLELLSDMEGWDHFFTSHTHRLYPVVVDALTGAGDSASLQVLSSYESWLRERGVEVAPEAIEALLGSCSEDELNNAPDWRDAFSNLSEERWSKIGDWLASRGRKLVV